MNVLPLTLKKKWFDMILSGEKKQEYRGIKPYWLTRLCFESFHLHKGIIYKIEIDNRFYQKKPFDVIEFKNGYSALAPTILIELNDITIGTGRTDWGAVSGEKYFVLELGDIIETKNIKP